MVNHVIDKKILHIQMNTVIHVNKYFSVRLNLFSFLLAVQTKRLSPVEKIEQSEPYRFFLSTVHGIPDSSNQTNAISLKGFSFLLTLSIR